MEQYTYERPRERLRRTGAHSLTTTELLQVLIASGTPKASGARIAKNVQQLFDSTQGMPSFEALLGISGLGVAKMCQLLAAIELGARTTRRAPKALVAIDSRVQQSVTMAIASVYIGGAGEVVGSFYAPFSDLPRSTVVLKQMFGEALAKGARSIEVTVGDRSQTIYTPGTAMLTVLRTLFDTASLLQIPTSVQLVNKHEARRIKRGVVYG